jgi:hypothetical protein
MSTWSGENAGHGEEQAVLLPPTDIPATPIVVRPTFDPKEYLAYMDGMDLTLEEKIDTLHTLWRMMDSFVAIAWREDPVQLLPAWREFSSTLPPDELTIADTTANSFNDVAHGDDAGKSET